MAGTGPAFMRWAFSLAATHYCGANFGYGGNSYNKRGLSLMAATPGRGSRNKGANGEREVAKIFRARGYNAQRTPNSGGLWIKGDLEGLPGLAPEIKRAERTQFKKWYEQALRDKQKGRMPLVIHRSNNSEWFVYCSLDHFLQLYEQVARKNLEQQEGEQ